MVKKNPSGLTSDCTNVPTSHITRPSPWQTSRITGYIVKQCIAHCCTIPHVCFLTSAPFPPGTIRLPAPATALSFLFPLCPTVALRMSCLWTAPFINTRQKLLQSDLGSVFLKRPEASCPCIWWPISPGQCPPPPPQAP